jgi:hypothetical protein
MNDTPGLLATLPARTAAVAAPPRVWTRPDGRRTLQLALATLWLFDGILQLQAFFFSRQFGTEMIASTARGNPSLVSRTINWSGLAIGHHAVITNALFALIQVGVGLGIAWRPTVRAALAVSVVWSLAVWWIGEGLGGVLSGGANPVDGAPGAVIIYALLAVLLWPSDRHGPRPSFIAGRAVGASTAKALWLVLWGSLSYFAVLGVNRSPQGLHDLIEGLAGGEPAWLAGLDRHAARVVDHRGLASMVILSVVLAVVAVGVYLPPRATNATLVVAILVSLVFWVVGEDFGMLFTNGATDVNSGPLLALLSVAFWNRSDVRSPEPGRHPAPIGVEG